MLYFSKIRIILIATFTTIFVYIFLSNFIKFDDNVFNKKINLGLDLQGGSYLLLEIDNTPVITQKLQNTIPELKKFFKEKKINLRNLNILASRKEFEKIIYIKVRSTGKLLNSRVTFKNNHAEVEILDKETGISPGQACVFYSTDEVGDKVLGGGWIDKTFNNNLST